jgi:hypothetical protein
MCKEVGSTDISKHLEFVEKFLVEGRELIDKDLVQVSEKLYKVAEEVVKVLVIALNLEEARKAIEKSRWGAELLFDVVDTISIKLCEDIHRLWHIA